MISPKAMTSSRPFSQIIYSAWHPLFLFPEVCPEFSSGGFFFFLKPSAQF